MYTAGKNSIAVAWTADRLAQSESLRIREKSLSIENQRVDRDYQIDKKRRADVDRATAIRLREYQAASQAPDTRTTSGNDDAHQAVANQCASAIAELDEYASKAVGLATALQSYVAGVCVPE